MSTPFEKAPLLSDDCGLADVSVVIPACNAEKTLGPLIASLKALSPEPREVIFVDDHSTDRTAAIARQARFKVIETDERAGPARARNMGIGAAKGRIVAFTDADCTVQRGWIGAIVSAMQDNDIEVVMGKVTIPESTFLGNSISALGFPGGGALGFEKMWRVDEKGFTDHISSCNFAARKSVFEECGLFDEGFYLAGCEDPELSRRLTRSGAPIKYVSSMVVRHAPRTRLGSFIKWQFVRGRANHLFKQRIGPVRYFIHLRLWSSMNIVKSYYKDIKFPLIFGLLFFSFLLQQSGFFFEKLRPPNKRFRAPGS